MPLQFGQIVNTKKRSLEDETDYTPKHLETHNAKLGALYKALDNTWGAQASDKVVDKLKKAQRWDLPIDLMKNVHCTFFTQADPNKPDKLDYMCKITFSYMQPVRDEKEEEKYINQYKGWPQTISGYVKSDAQDYIKKYGGEMSVTFSDVTQKYTGADVMVTCNDSNLSQKPATSNISAYHVPRQDPVKNLYTLTKVYKITVK